MPLAPVGVCSSTGRPIEICYETFGSPADEAVLLIMGLGVCVCVCALLDAGYLKGSKGRRQHALRHGAVCVRRLLGVFTIAMWNFLSKYITDR